MLTANLSISTSEDKSRFTGQCGLGFNLRNLGSLSLNYSSSDYYYGTDSKTYSIFYSKNLSQSASLLIRASRTQADEITNEIFAGINLHLGHKRSASLYYTKQEENTSQVAQFRQNAPLGTGLGYDLSIEKGILSAILFARLFDRL